MLVLTRKVGERLVIGDNIVVTVVEVKGENIKLALEAPQEIKIYRGELYDAIVAENRLAAEHSNCELADLKNIRKIFEKPTKST